MSIEDTALSQTPKPPKPWHPFLKLDSLFHAESFRAAFRDVGCDSSYLSWWTHGAKYKSRVDWMRSNLPFSGPNPATAGRISEVILFRFEKSAGFRLLPSHFSPCLASCGDRCDLQETGSRLYDLAQPLAVLESDLGIASKCRPLHSSMKRKR